MDRKEALAKMCLLGMLPGAIVGGLIGLAIALFREPRAVGTPVNNILFLFPVGALLGGLIGAIAGALYADHKYPP